MPLRTFSIRGAIAFNNISVNVFSNQSRRGKKACRCVFQISIIIQYDHTSAARSIWSSSSVLPTADDKDPVPAFICCRPKDASHLKESRL